MKEQPRRACLIDHQRRRLWFIGSIPVSNFHDFLGQFRIVSSFGWGRFNGFDLCVFQHCGRGSQWVTV